MGENSSSRAVSDDHQLMGRARNHAQAADTARRGTGISLRNELVMAHRDNPELAHAYQAMVDVDSTWYPLVDAMRTRPGTSRLRMADIDTWERMPELIDGGVPRMLELFSEVMRFDVMKHHPPFPHAVDAARVLRAHGIKVLANTHRPAELEDDVRRWLDHFGLPYDDLVCDLKTDKLQWCLDNGVGILVDDHPQLLRDAHAAGLDAFSLPWPYNAQVLSDNGTPPAAAWDGIAEHVLGAVERRVRAHLLPAAA